jgi:hypothetical protein
MIKMKKENERTYALLKDFIAKHPEILHELNSPKNPNIDSKDLFDFYTKPSVYINKK